HRRQLWPVLHHICSITAKEITDLVIEDFNRTPFPEHLIDNGDLFSSQIELIFYNYAKRRHENNIDFLNKREYNDQNEAISDDSFIKKIPPPWTIINETLAKLNIDFYFQELPRRFDPENNFSIKLMKKSINKPVGFNDLSSGEQVIIGLILKLFTGEYYSTHLQFPELIIFDEPDAPLHPEMSKLLIDVFLETFVKRFGIKIIFTTHSPSTVALAPEDSIYQLKNGEPTTLLKISKDEALKILTGFIPTLSIDYRSHRQVFVESPIDVLYYQSLYSKHIQNELLIHQLYFIANSQGKGNSSLVYSILQEMTKADNKSIYGVVDWDTKNNDTHRVLVHGINSRYSIENFILDPVYLIILLIQMNNAHNILSITGVSKTDNE
ncbi:MAG: ATP-binding protein, partial [Chitinophagaceae bacterium]|nr:ATP-binding protein [Chitinophagaceae bacterium]